MKLKDLVTLGKLSKGDEIPKPFHSIILYSKGVQYLHSNGIAIGEHDGICYQAYGKNCLPPDFWMYIDCE